MKNIFSLSIVIWAALGLSAQEVSEGMTAMHAGTHNAFYIDLPDASASFAEKAWKDFIDQYGKAKKVRKSDEWVVEGAQILNIGGVNSLNLYTRTEATGNGSRHYLWIDSGGSYIDSDDNGDAAEYTRDMLKEFAHKVKVDMITLELDEQQRALDNLEKDLGKLKKDNESYHKTIEDAKERIAKAETDIIKNVQDQEIRSQEIEQQRQIVEEVRMRLEKTRAKEGS